jgi:hypothetical protein
VGLSITTFCFPQTETYTISLRPACEQFMRDSGEHAKARAAGIMLGPMDTRWLRAQIGRKQHELLAQHRSLGHKEHMLFDAQQPPTQIARQNNQKMWFCFRGTVGRRGPGRPAATLAAPHSRASIVIQMKVMHVMISMRRVFCAGSPRASQWVILYCCITCTIRCLHLESFMRRGTLLPCRKTQSCSERSECQTYNASLGKLSDNRYSSTVLMTHTFPCIRITAFSPLTIP